MNTNKTDFSLSQVCEVQLTSFLNQMVFSMAVDMAIAFPRSQTDLNDDSLPKLNLCICWTETLSVNVGWNRIPYTVGEIPSIPSLLRSKAVSILLNQIFLFHLKMVHLKNDLKILWLGALNLISTNICEYEISSVCWLLNILVKIFFWCAKP